MWSLRLLSTTPSFLISYHISSPYIGVCFELAIADELGQTHEFFPSLGTSDVLRPFSLYSSPPVLADTQSRTSAALVPGTSQAAF